MSEYTLQLIASLKIVWIAVFAYLYGRGGIYNKAWRRYISSFFITLGVCGFAAWTQQFSAWLLLSYPLLVGAFSLGYGADSFSEKAKKRFIYGLACATAMLPIAIVNKSLVMFGYYAIIVPLTSVFLGVINPCKSAREEETVIAAVIGLALFL